MLERVVKDMDDLANFRVDPRLNIVSPMLGIFDIWYSFGRTCLFNTLSLCDSGGSSSKLRKLCI